VSAARQALVVFAILAFTAAFGFGIHGVRALFGPIYVEPECAAACAARGESLADIEYHTDKQRTPSICVCSGGARVASDRAATLAHASVGAMIALGLGTSGLVIFVVYRRAMRKRKDAP